MRSCFWIVLFLLIPLNSFALINIKFLNNSTQKLELLSIDTRSFQSLNPLIYSEVLTKKYVATQSQRLAINNNYFIQVVDTEKECSYLNAFNVRYSNGTILNIFINNIDMGSICSTKKHYLTSAKNIELIFNSELNSISASESLIIRNNGWWANTNGYPVEKNILLTPVKNNFSLQQTEYFMTNGI